MDSASASRFSGSGSPSWWLHDTRKMWVLAAVGVGTFMSALNSSIVNAVLPAVMKSLQIDFGTAEWITMVFLVLVSGLLLSFGRLGDLLGHKRVYLSGFAVFVFAAVGCGLSRSATALIVARAAQAVGSAMILSNAPALLVRAFPPSQRGQALGLQGTCTYLGLMVGPALGGWLTERAGWPSIFLISAPFGLLAIALAWSVMPNEARSAHRERFDVAGAATFLAGLSCLLLALSHGQSWGWASGRVVGLLGTAAVSLAGFFGLESRRDSPMIDLSLFRERIVVAATSSALLNYVCIYAVMFLVPFYLHHFRGFPPSQTGLLLSSQAITMAILAPIAGSLSDRIGSRIPASLGMAVLTVGLVVLSTLDASASRMAIAGRLALLGVGSGMFAAPNNSALMGAAPRERQGVAAAVLACARNVGMVLGIAIAGAVFARVLAAHGGNIETGVGFLPAFRVTFLILAIFGVAATLTSLARGSRPVPPAAMREIRAAQGKER